MRDNLKEDILNESSRLFSESGFFGTSMNDIAKSLNITKPALYYHFKSKKGLYLEVLNRAFEKLARKFKKARKLSKLIRNYLEWGTGEKNLIKAQMAKFPDSDIETRGRVSEFRKKIENEFTKTLKNTLKKEVNFKFLTSFLLGTMDRIILDASFLGKEINVKEKTFQIIKVLNPFIKGRKSNIE